MTTPDRIIPSLGPISEYALRDILRNQQERADVADKLYFPLVNNQGVAIIDSGRFLPTLTDDSDPNPANWVYGGPPTATLTASELLAIIIFVVAPPADAVLLVDMSLFDASVCPLTHYVAQFGGSFPLLIDCIDTPNPFYLRASGFAEMVAVSGNFGVINAFDAAYVPQISEYTAASIDVDSTNFKQIVVATTGCSAAVVKANTLAQDGDVIRFTNKKAAGNFTLSAGVGVTIHVPSTLKLVLVPYESATLRRMALDEWVMETGPAA